MWCRSWAHTFQTCPSLEPVVGSLPSARTRTRRGLGPGVFSPTSHPEHSDCPLNLFLSLDCQELLFPLQMSPWENLLCPVLFSACLLSPCKCRVLGHVAGSTSSTWGHVWAAFGGTLRSQVVSSCPTTFWETDVAISTVSVDLFVSPGSAIGSKFCLLHKLSAWFCPLNELTFSSTGSDFLYP